MVKKSEMIKSSECYILGFDNITHSGLEVLKAVTANAKQCAFGVINNIGLNNSYIVEPEMLENVRDFCKELKISYTEVELKGSSTTIGSHIRHNLFAYPYKKMQIGNEINIIECKNIIELDWSGDLCDDEGCSGHCHGCSSCEECDEDDDM